MKKIWINLDSLTVSLRSGCAHKPESFFCWGGPFAYRKDVITELGRYLDRQPMDTEIFLFGKANSYIVEGFKRVMSLVSSRKLTNKFFSQQQTLDAMARNDTIHRITEAAIYTQLKHEIARYTNQPFNMDCPGTNLVLQMIRRESEGRIYPMFDTDLNEQEYWIVDFREGMYYDFQHSHLIYFRSGHD